MRKILKFLTSRMLWVAIVIGLQVGWIVLSVMRLANYYWVINLILSLLGLLLVIDIVHQWINPAYKMAWSILILSVPIVGAVLYLLFGRANVIVKHRRRHRLIDNDLYPHMIQDPTIRRELQEESPRAARQFGYLYRQNHFPVFRDQGSRYFSCGEDYFAALCEALKKAERFIFLEYFIIDRGEMWNTILEILKEKVAEGVEVRLLYDDVGCIWLLPRDYPKQMEKFGIQCRRFNPVRPVLSAIYNNRDHRKIVVVDGNTAFTGGVNLADEYINIKCRFGTWKDGGVQIEGDAVWNDTVMFLGMWNSISHSDTDYEKYRAAIPYEEEKRLGLECGILPAREGGYVQPYGDTPLDHECTGESVYLNMIHQAVDYVYICTPYLIIDQEMMIALTLAAKNGVDVRIMTPHIPDKKMIFMLTRSYYEQLIEAGVRIYEYEPGFLHTKSFVADDEIAAVGSINLDYRSLYLHFECGVLLYRTEAVEQVKNDFINTMKKDGIEITEEFCRKRPLWERALVACMRLLAPLF